MYSSQATYSIDSNVSCLIELFNVLKHYIVAFVKEAALDF